MVQSDAFFQSAEWYDVSINWPARLAREVPLLREVFGPPGELGLLDAGCGTGRHTVELARVGYRMTGLDPDEDMLSLARQHARHSGVLVDHVSGTYEELPDRAPGPFDGVFCLGNALAACASAEAARRAVRQFAAALRRGARLFIQILNFPPMRHESPCVRGPRVVVRDGIEYVSTRVFHFSDDAAEVTNVTLWNDGQWRQRAHRGRLYPITPGQMDAWCAEAGLCVDERLGTYDRAPFDPAASLDLLVIATR